MASLRRSLSLFAALLSLVQARAQVPPQAVEAAKKVGAKLVEKLLTPKMQVESFTLGGFKATRVDVDGDATAEKFSGNALFDLPKPLGPQKLDFKNLVLKGSVAEGGLEAALPKGFSAKHQEWTYELTKVYLSDKGSHVEGTCWLAGIRLDVSPLTLMPQGLQGTLTPGDLALAEGAFTASLLEASVVFGPQAVNLKGNLEVVIPPPAIHGATGGDLKFEVPALTFNSTALSGTATVAGSLATNLPLRYKSQAWLFQKLAFGFERGIPRLGSPVQYQFPLNVFCKTSATAQAYLSDAVPCGILGRVPKLENTVAKLSVRKATTTPPAVAVRLAPEWEGFSGSFPLPAASLVPSGLTSYHLDLTRGTLRVDKGLPEPIGTQLTGRLSWGPSYTLQTEFTDAPASLADGLYVQGSLMKMPAMVGPYRVHTFLSRPVCDFTPSHSPEGLPKEWMGVYLSGYFLELPIELYTFNSKNERRPVPVMGKAGRFEGNGTFSGSVAAKIPGLVNLHIAPVRLDPFELNFFEGALIEGPVVKGHLDLTAEPLLEHFQAPVQFHLTQNGVEEIQIDTQTPDGPMGSKTRLTGITMVLDSARLFPTTMDFAGRFDFAITGTALPSIPFDHLTLEASGGGIDGSHEDLSLDFTGSRWSEVANKPNVVLWGYPLGLMENGYGVFEDRFYVGLGGDLDVNPLVPTLYNRILFTTDDKNNPLVRTDKPWDFNLSIASMGSLNAHLDFHVDTAGDQVSDAYFDGNGALKVETGSGSLDLGAQAGMRFGRNFDNNQNFPYFYAMGQFESETAAVPVAPDFEIYGASGGIAQNFQPDDIGNLAHITGKPDNSLGLGIIAGIKAGTTDRFTFHGGLNLYISQNLTTILQGDGWLFCGRQTETEDNKVSADIRFTRNPNMFDATLDANLNLPGGIMRAIGRVELHFAPDQSFLHIGTREAPIDVSYLGSWDGWGFFTSDFQNGTSTLAAGGGVTYRKEGDFGIVYGDAWLTAQGDMVIVLDDKMNPSFSGCVGAEGGAEFGMKFKTWKTYHITIFSGSIGANLAFQAPDHPTFSGAVTIHYRVLGGLFKGSVGASLDI